MGRYCELCGTKTVSLSDRFCKGCRRAQLAEMQSEGYLGPAPRGHIGQQRTADQKEIVRETKFGTEQR